MKTLINTLSLCCLLFTIAMANSADAQQTNQQFQLEAQLGLSHILSLGGVPEELGMDADQQFELADLWAMTQMRLQDSFGKFAREYGEILPTAEVDALKERLQSEIAEIREWELEQLKLILNDGQIERLRQIKRQYLTRKNPSLMGLKEELDLSESQIKRIQSISKKMNEEMLEHRKTALEMKAPEADIMASIEQIKKNAIDELLAVLDSSQRSKLESLEGKEFKFQDGSYVAPESGEDESEKEKDATDKDSSGDGGN